MIVQAHCDKSALLYILGLATLFLGLPRIKCLFLAELTEQTDKHGPFLIYHRNPQGYKY